MEAKIDVWDLTSQDFGSGENVVSFVSIEGSYSGIKENEDKCGGEVDECLIGQINNPFLGH